MWFLLPFTAFAALGCVGVLSLYLTTRDMARGLLADAPVPGLGEGRLGVLMLVNPAVLVLLGAAVGTLLADRAGLRSVLLDLARGRGINPPNLSEGALALALGLGVAVVIVLVLNNVQSAGWLPRDLTSGNAGKAGLLSGLLYGGLAEEIMVRFGLMTLFLWPLTHVLGGDGHSSEAAAWAAIVLAAAAFGLGHLPQAAMVTPLTVPVVLYIVGLNMVAGVAYGWLYWRGCLELAMLAHMATHVGFWLTQVVLPARGPGMG